MFKKISSVKRLTINEDEFLEYEIQVLKKKLILAIQDADNNLLDDNVLNVSRQLDKLILKFINTKNLGLESND